MKLTSSLNAWRANTAEPPRSECSEAPSAYVIAVNWKNRPPARKTTGVRPLARWATTPSAKYTELTEVV